MVCGNNSVPRVLFPKSSAVTAFCVRPVLTALKNDCACAKFKRFGGRFSGHRGRMSAHAPVSGDFEHFVDCELFGREETTKFFCCLCSKYLANHGLDH